MNQEQKTKSWAFAIWGFPLFIGLHIAQVLIYNHYDSMPIGSYFQKGIDPLSPGAVLRMMDKPTLIILGLILVGELVGFVLSNIALYYYFLARGYNKMLGVNPAIPIVLKMVFSWVVLGILAICIQMLISSLLFVNR